VINPIRGVQIKGKKASLGQRATAQMEKKDKAKCSEIPLFSKRKIRVLIKQP
jgi:hypothetical protein